MNNPMLTKNFTADGDVTPYRVVKFSTDDDLIADVADVTDLGVGVADYLGAGDGERLDVILVGVAPVEYGGNVTRGQRLTWDATGKAVAAAGANVRCLGIAMESGVTGDIGSCLLIPGMLHVDAA